MQEHPNQNPRGSGLLLHPTSLPGPHGVGDLGTPAYRFVDFLREAGQAYWQTLPVGPLSMGNSPYQALSAYAGGEHLINLEKLADQGYLDPKDLAADPPFRADRVDYGNAAKFREERLWKAFLAFERGLSGDARGRFEAFREENRGWLRDYALFRALKAANGMQSWTTWPEPLRKRDARALSQARDQYAIEIRYQEFLQYQFEAQWSELRAYAHDRGVRLIGDLPIYVAHDSADVWGNQDLFFLEPDGSLTVQAGVPPDYFCEDGQLWGNPLYRWDLLGKRAYDWWIERFRVSFDLFDILRLDHFIGFVRYYEVAGDAKNARVGEWRPGPGSALFEKALEVFGHLPIIAEDLGLVTPEVIALRERFRFPGMRILQFGFGGGLDNPHKPYVYDRNGVVYTGTHDNDTVATWFACQTGPDGVRSAEGNTALIYAGTDGAEIHWDLTRLALMSVCDTAILPVQDILGTGVDSRMNCPGKAEGNWEWRYEEGALTPNHAMRLKTLTEAFGRLPWE